jgi:hypothetical protein
MSNEKLGVEQIIKVLDAIIEGGNVSEKVAKADSTIGKVMAVVPMADELLRLMSLSPVVLQAEWKDLDEPERTQLRAHFRAKFDIEDDELEGKVELGLELVSESVAFVEKIVEYGKSLRKKE